MTNEFTVADMNQNYILVPRDSGGGTVNLTVAQISDKQFREWVRAKAEIAGIQMIVPMGRIGYETRVNMLNRLSQGGVKVYKLGG
jgi:hypothetical protein